MRLEVRHLEVLLAIEEASSISGAARRLGIDQPHVTRQLRRIEERLGVEIFLRTTKGVKPTAAGLRVLTLARRALSVIDDLTEPEAGQDPSRTRELLRILYYGIPAIAVLDDLSNRFPGLQVRFSTTTPEDAYDQLRAGAADVFLGVWLPHIDWPAAAQLATMEILADPTHVYLAADHPLAASSELRLGELAGEGWITGVDTDSWTMVSEECRLVGGFDPQLSHRVGDEVAISTLLSRGHGVMLGSSVAARRAGVIGRAYVGASSARWMQVYQPGRVDREIVAVLADLLRSRYAFWTEQLRGQRASAGDTAGPSQGAAGHR